MRLRVIFTAILIILMSAAGSKSADNGATNINNSTGLTSARSCYNYTFIDNRSIRGTILEQEQMDSLPYKPDSISYDAVKNVCNPNGARQLASIMNTDLAGAPSDVQDDLSDSLLLLNPSIRFIEDDKMYFRQLQSKDTIFYGGLVPFVAVHDADLGTDDHFFNPDSVSLFLYFKRKF